MPASGTAKRQLRQRNRGTRQDRVFAAVMALRQPGALEQDAPQGRFDPPPLEVVQTHYRPFHAGRILARPRGSADPGATCGAEHMLFVQVYSKRSRAKARYKSSYKRSLRRNRTPLPEFFKELRAVAWRFPNIPLLRSTQVCLAPAAFQEWIAEHLDAHARAFEGRLPELVRCVPRKRALFRHVRNDRQGHVYLKFPEAGRSHALAHHLSLVEGSALGHSLGFTVPGLLFHDPSRGAIGMTEVPGTPLTSLAGREHADLFQEVGRRLADLHSKDLTPERLWTPLEELQALRRAMLDVQAALPCTESLLARCLAMLEREWCSQKPHEVRPVHANLFGDQILVSDSTIGLVDWDDLALGDPLFDLGRLAAHLMFLAAAGEADSTAIARNLVHLIDGYRKQWGSRVDLYRLRWHVGVALILRAKISALRTLCDGWERKVESALATGERILADPAPSLGRWITEAIAQ